jgi:hypothetical protein
MEDPVDRTYRHIKILKPYDKKPQDMTVIDLLKGIPEWSVPLSPFLLGPGNFHLFFTHLFKSGIVWRSYFTKYGKWMAILQSVSLSCRF